MCHNLFSDRWIKLVEFPALLLCSESVKLKYPQWVWAPCCLSFSICLLLLFVFVPVAPSLILLYLHEQYVEQYPKSVGEIEQSSLSTCAFTFKLSWLNLRIWVWSHISSFSTKRGTSLREFCLSLTSVSTRTQIPVLGYFSWNKAQGFCVNLIRLSRVAE